MCVVREILSNEIPELTGIKGVVVSLTGSDGRTEKLSSESSNVELEIILDRKELLESGILEKFKQLVSSNSKHPNVFYPEIRVYSLDVDSLIHFNRNSDWTQKKNLLPFPTRALDGLYVIGDPETFHGFKKLLFSQIGNPSNQKPLEKFRNDRVRPTLNLLRALVKQLAEDKLTGCEAPVAAEPAPIATEAAVTAAAGAKDHAAEGEQEAQAMADIDIANGVLRYDGDRVKATKYPLLRPVQYQLAQHVIRLIKNKKIREDVFLQMPATIVERIEWLAQNKLINISSAQVQNVQKAYIISLAWCGIATKRFEVLHETQTQVPVKDLQIVVKAIAEFCLTESIFAPANPGKH